jgi:peptide-methionine (R)-S-oxide reductase
MADTSGFDLAPPSPEQREQLTAGLSPEERDVLLRHGTEAPFCGVLLHEKRKGVFTCRLCGLPLFLAGAKFESGTGWPSFSEPIPGAVDTVADDTYVGGYHSGYGTIRTEVSCATCGSHLGHVFTDGPPPSGLRYCTNGVALKFALPTAS